jgi:hypothetical protein
MTATRRLASIATILAVAGLLAAGANAAPQSPPSFCADCHFANGGKPNPMHLEEWEASPHERAGVGCEKCHGGNPQTVDAFLAHQSIVRGRGPDTPVHPRQLPKTCGTCHSGPYTQFQKSRHHALLEQGSYEGPTCATCHGTVAAYLLSPKALEHECNGCHARGRKAAHPEYAGDARALLEGTRTVRQMLSSARPVIAKTKDAALRASLEADYQQAEVPLTEAVYDAHAFVFTDARERLGVAHARADALLGRLANRDR